MLTGWSVAWRADWLECGLRADSPGWLECGLVCRLVGVLVCVLTHQAGWSVVAGVDYLSVLLVSCVLHSTGRLLEQTGDGGRWVLPQKIIVDIVCVMSQFSGGETDTQTDRQTDRQRGGGEREKRSERASRQAKQRHTELAKVKPTAAFKRGVEGGPGDLSTLQRSRSIKNNNTPSQTDRSEAQGGETMQLDPVLLAGYHPPSLHRERSPKHVLLPPLAAPWWWWWSSQ